VVKETGTREEEEVDRPRKCGKNFPRGKKHQKRGEISSREDDHDDDDDNTLELGSERSSEGGNSNHNHHHSPSNSCKELEKEGRMMVLARNSIHYDDYVTVGSHGQDLERCLWRGSHGSGHLQSETVSFLRCERQGPPR